MGDYQWQREWQVQRPRGRQKLGLSLQNARLITSHLPQASGFSAWAGMERWKPSTACYWPHPLISEASPGLEYPLLLPTLALNLKKMYQPQGLCGSWFRFSDPLALGLEGSRECVAWGSGSGKLDKREQSSFPKKGAWSFVCTACYLAS